MRIIGFILGEHRCSNSLSSIDESSAMCLVTRSVKIKWLPLAEGIVLSSFLRGIVFQQQNMSSTFLRMLWAGLRHCGNTCIF
jgi:hypothetical protein